MSEETQDNHNLNEPGDAGEPIVYAVGKTAPAGASRGASF